MESTQIAADLADGVLAGVLGTGVMTAFQKLVEMPATGRSDSYAPADFAARVLRLRPRTAHGRRRLNYAVHVALGATWGAAYGGAAAVGLRGQCAVHTVFATVWTGDLALNTALGLYRPTTWSRQDWLVGLVDKYVQAQATGLFFDRLVEPPDPRPVDDRADHRPVRAASSCA